VRNTFTLHPTLARDTVEVVRLPLCRVLLMNDRRFPWLILVPERENVRAIQFPWRSVGPIDLAVIALFAAAAAGTPTAAPADSGANAGAARDGGTRDS